MTFVDKSCVLWKPHFFKHVLCPTVNCEIFLALGGNHKDIISQQSFIMFCNRPWVSNEYELTLGSESAKNVQIGQIFMGIIHSTYLTMILISAIHRPQLQNSTLTDQKWSFATKPLLCCTFLPFCVAICERGVLWNFFTPLVLLARRNFGMRSEA